MYPKLVKFFYSNLKYEMGGLISTMVKGVEILFDIERMSTSLEIPCDRLSIFFLI